MAIMIPDRRLTIPLPIIVPQHAEILFPLTTAPKSPARTRDRASKDGFMLCFLSAQTLHYHNYQIRCVLAAVEDIVRLDRCFEIVVKRGVVERLP